MTLNVKNEGKKRGPEPERLVIPPDKAKAVLDELLRTPKGARPPKSPRKPKRVQK